MIRYIRIDRDIPMTMRDGVRLRAGIYRRMIERNTRPLSFARGEDFLPDLTPASDTIVSMKTAPKARQRAQTSYAASNQEAIYLA